MNPMFDASECCALTLLPHIFDNVDIGDSLSLALWPMRGPQCLHLTNEQRSGDQDKAVSFITQSHADK